MNITQFGNNLKVLITANYNLQDDWRAFATWYSIYKTIPDATISVICARELKAYAAFAWTYRTETPFFQYKKEFPEPLGKLHAIFVAVKEKLTSGPLLVVDASVVCVRPLMESNLNDLNNFSGFLGQNEPIWFLPDPDIKQIANYLETGQEPKSEQLENLCSNCTDVSITPFVHYTQCGKYSPTQWENQKLPPFGMGTRLHTPVLTPNEQRILELWDQISSTYWAIK